MSERSPITTHVLDTARGRPAAGVPVMLSRMTDDGGAWQVLASGVTDQDGRITNLLQPGSLISGTYRMRFDTAVYFAASGVREFFYPWVEVAFQINTVESHYHVPLLLNPFGYSTYRGS